MTGLGECVGPPAIKTSRGSLALLGLVKAPGWYLAPKVKRLLWFCPDLGSIELLRKKRPEAPDTIRLSAGRAMAQDLEAGLTYRLHCREKG